MKKIISIVLIAIISIIAISTTSNATVSISNTDLYSKGYYEDYLSWGDLGGLVFNYVVYKKDGIEYPAYCLDKDLPGVEIGSGYSVNIDKLVSNVKVWKAIINGYPYKTYKELGCQSEEEAYFATKQAVYCMLYDRDPNTYSATDARSTRTLNALKKIVSSANASTETKVSSDLTIKSENDIWEVDKINNKCVSKTFKISAKSTIQSYTITLNEKPIEGMQIVDEKNNEKKEFKDGEKFKILIPIQNMKNDGKFNIVANGKVATKPILYGSTSKIGYQDYALAGAIYEDGKGEKTITYAKNKTKIIVLKQDKETAKPLQGVTFELLNKEKEAVYTDLTTNVEGKIIIDNLLPGTYYLKEIATLNEYGIFDEDIEIKVELNQTFTVKVNNSKEEVIEKQPESKTEIETDTESEREETVQPESQKKKETDIKSEREEIVQPESQKEKETNIKTEREETIQPESQNQKETNIETKREEVIQPETQGQIEVEVKLPKTGY